MRTPLLAGTVMLVCGVSVPAQDPPAPRSREARVDAVFARWDTTQSPGCALSVIAAGEIVYRRGYGMAHLDHDVPIRPDTVFHVASVSKQFTAAAIALLALEGRLSLDDPVRQHLPWVPDFGPAMTIRHLVHHTSGLRDQWSLLEMSGWRYSRDLITNDDVTYLIRRQRDLNFEPGERFLYSNTGYTLMGLIVARVSGQSLRAFTTERIFKPLGMTQTHFRDDFTEIVKDHAVGYRWDEDTRAFHSSVTNFDTVGATSLLTTVEDLARWEQNFIDPVVGGPAFLDLMHQRGRLTRGEEQDYAFGLVHGTYRGRPTIGHGGGDAGYRANVVRFPDQGYSVATLCNVGQANPARLALDVADIYLERELDPSPAGRPETTPVTLTDDAFARIAGAYWADGLATVVRVERAAEVLQFRVGGQRSQMVHTGGGRFRVPGQGGNVRFEPETGEVERVRFWLDAEGEDEATLATRLTPPERDEAALRDYVGAYQSPELPVIYYIDLTGGQLRVYWFKSDPTELTPVAQDVLIGDGVGSLRFRRGADGRISGFLLDAGRVRNFRFDRAR